MNRVRLQKRFSVVWLMIIACLPAEAAELHYQIQPQQIVPYQVDITVKTPTTVETMSGLIAFTGKAVNDKSCTVVFVGNLSQQTKYTDNRGQRSRFGIRRGMPPLPGFMGQGVSFGGLFRTTNTLVIGHQGDIQSLTGQSQLPWLLGNLSLLPFEALPPDERQEWEVDSGISVTEQEESPFFGGPFRGNTRVKVGGKESSKYKILSDDGKLVTIQKTYHLISPAASKEDEATEINGTGTFVFNREWNCSESLKMEQTLVVTKEASNINLPMTIAFHRVPQEDWDAQEARLAELQANARKASAERQAKQDAAAKEAAGKKLSAEAKAEIMRDLNAKHWPDVQDQLQKLKRFEPHPDDFDIAMRVKELQDHKVVGVFLKARELWKRLEPIVAAGQKSKAMAKADASNPFATPEEKQAGDAAVLRKWSDASGLFQVEAVFLKFEDDNILLKRSDGKEIRVPLDQLSEADREFAATLKQKATEKPEPSAAPKNPFE